MELSCRDPCGEVCSRGTRIPMLKSVSYGTFSSRLGRRRDDAPACGRTPLPFSRLWTIVWVWRVRVRARRLSLRVRHVAEQLRWVGTARVCGLCIAVSGHHSERVYAFSRALQPFLKLLPTYSTCNSTPPPLSSRRIRCTSSPRSLKICSMLVCGPNQPKLSAIRCCASQQSHRTTTIPDQPQRRGGGRRHSLVSDLCM